LRLRRRAITQPRATRRKCQRSEKALFTLAAGNIDQSIPAFG
jgi:hypothetical protein